MGQDFVSSDDGVQVVEVDLKVYSIDSLIKTAYWYTDRCYLHLQYSGSDIVEVRFKLKPGSVVQNLPETFLNDLLDQTLRERVAKQSEPFKNLILAHALSKTSLINSDLETAEPFQDPKNISLPDEAKKAHI